MGKAKNTNNTFNTTAVDFLSFYQRIFDQLQALRGLDPIRSGVLVERSDQFGQTENGESLVNVFLRSIGLPAIRNDEEIAAKYNLNLPVNQNHLTQGETLNYIPLTELPDTWLTIETRERRLQSLNSVSQVQFNETSVIDGLSFMLTPYSITTNQFGYPLVAGDITIYPLSRRVTPLFFDGDYIDGNSVMPRAFIESVIANIYFKSNDNIAEQEMRESIAELTENGLTADSLKDKNLLVLRYLQKSISAMQAAAQTYFGLQALRDLQYKRASYVPVLKRSGPNIKQGYFDKEYSEIKEILLTTDEGQALLSKLSEPELDQAIRLQQTKVSEDDSFFNLLPYVVQGEQEQILRAASGLETEPAKTLFADMVVEIATIDRGPKLDRLSSLIEERRILRNDMEVVRGQLEIFSSQTTGLSIFDIFATFNALYLLDEKDLFGLLNQSALDRLQKKEKSLAIGNENISAAIAARSSPADAINALKTKITDQLNLAQLFFDKAGKNGNK